MQFRKNILSLSPYKPPLSNRVDSGMHLLDFNERSCPLSSEILEKLAAWCLAGVSHIYPDYSGLFEKISDYTKVLEKNIFIGNGSDQIIDCIMRAILNKGDKIIIPKPSFAMFEQLASLEEAEIINYDLLADDPFTEIENLLQLKPRLIVFCQPNNPTGRMLDIQKIDELIKKYRDTWFFIDEAYFEYSCVSQLDITKDYENLIVSRTFSKAFGLAALRLGYMVSSEKMVEQCLKIRGPYDINQFACFAGQVVLDHVEEIQDYSKKVMRQHKEKIETALRDKDIDFLPSEANFLCVQNELALAEFLSENGIRVRKMSQPELNNSFRMTIGDEEITKLVLKLLADYKKG